MLAWPGKRLAKLLAGLIYLIAWQGKVVNRRESLLRNKITPVRLRLIKAKLSHDDSWVDQRECVLLDYSRTSWVARMVRDELRLVGPEPVLGCCVALATARRMVHVALARGRRGLRPGLRGWPSKFR